MVLEYYNKDQLTTVINVDYKRQTVAVTNYTDKLIDRAFGIKENPSFQDYEDFLESRCFPRTRAYMKWILQDLGLDYYDPLSIIKKTSGVMAEDHMWLKIIEEDHDYAR